MYVLQSLTALRKQRKAFVIPEHLCFKIAANKTNRERNEHEYRAQIFSSVFCCLDDRKPEK